MSDPQTAARAGATPPVPDQAALSEPPARPAVEVRGLEFSYGSRPILRGVDLAFPEGAVSALVGPNGCGKSTLVKHITRALSPKAGTVSVLGDDVARLGRREVARRVAVLAQGGIVPGVRVEQFVAGGRYPYSGAFSAPNADDRRIVAAAMEQAGCARFAGCDMRSLSGGERQRVHLAMVLAQQTPVVVMDEPTTYLDVSACFDLMDLVRDLNRAGKTVIMVLHDLNLALTCCDHVAVMRAGELVCAGAPSAVAQSGVVEEVFGVRLRRVEEEGRLYYCLLPRR